MPRTVSDGLSLHYDSLGPSDGPALVLLAGAGRPASDYDAQFCDPLIRAGCHLLRIDSRDTGLSNALTGHPARLRAVRDGAAPVYGVAEMAADVRAVMDHAGIDRAVLVGRSLGAQVAQLLAVETPERVAGLALIMAASRSVAGSVPDATLDRLETEVIVGAEAYVARQERTLAALGLPQDQDPARIREDALAAWARGIPPGGAARHFAAGLAMPDLRPALAALRCPTLILHGAADPLIPPDFARETAAAIPGATLEIWPDMAHDGPPRLRRRWAERILEWLAAPGDLPASHM